MNNLSTIAMPWTLNDIKWNKFEPEKTPEDLVQVFKTTCLIESRSSLYASYLISVFTSSPHWTDAIKQWEREEKQHGQSLSEWCKLVDPDFNFEKTYSKYLEKEPYYGDKKESVRGSTSGELIVRCLVEAMASGYYRALMDACQEPVIKEICLRLSRDEARHFGMFKNLFLESQRTEKLPTTKIAKVMLMRLLQLEDSQIKSAAKLTGEGYKFESLINCPVRNYYWQLYGTYKLHHIHYILSFVLPLLELPTNGALHNLLSFGGYCLIKTRRFLAIIF